jgi:N-acetylglutamate synthase/N-acetylornithine aminotransferase
MSEGLSLLVSVSGRIDVDRDVSTLQDRFLALLQDDETVTLLREDHPPLANVVAAVIRVNAKDRREMAAIAHGATKRALVTAGREIMGDFLFGTNTTSQGELETGSD